MILVLSRVINFCGSKISLSKSKAPRNNAAKYPYGIGQLLAYCSSGTLLTTPLTQTYEVKTLILLENTQV